MTERLSTPPMTVVALVLLTLLTGSTACSDSQVENGNPTADQSAVHANFLTPVAAAQKAGVEPYWMGREFRADTKQLTLVEFADFDEAWGPNLRLDYVSHDGGMLAVTSFASRSGAAERLQATLNTPGGTRRSIQIGRWSGELFTFSNADRPVNNVIVYLEVEGTTVRVVAGSVESGIPGEDPNPLIDSDLLLSVIEQNLRPLP